MPTVKERLTYAAEIKETGFGGLKTILGAALIVLSHQLLLLQDLIPVFPDTSVLEGLVTKIEWAIEWLTWAATWSGNGLLSVGIVDKFLKFFRFR